VFDDKESAVLLALYEVADGTYTSYTLAWKLNPTVQVGTPPAAAAFAQTRDATERLIARGLMRGKRSTGADGVYFDKLKLTAKGEQTAIQHRKDSEETKKALAEAIKEASSTLAEMKKFENEKGTKGKG
jgi:hypothetical protein